MISSFPNSFEIYGRPVEMAMFVVVYAGGILVGGTLLLRFMAGFGFLKSRLPYRRGRFLSANEKCFLAALDDVLGDRYRVFAHVRLAELVDVNSSVAGAKKWQALNKVTGKSIDFVICDAASLDSVGAIELDDRSHLIPARRERDVFVNAVFDAIGLPLVRIKARANYSADFVREALAVAALARKERKVA